MAAMSSGRPSRGLRMVASIASLYAAGSWSPGCTQGRTRCGGVGPDAVSAPSSKRRARRGR